MFQAELKDGGVVRTTSVAYEATITRGSIMAANYRNIVKKDQKIFEKIGIALDGEVLSFITMVREARRTWRPTPGMWW